MKINLTIWEMVPEESIQYMHSHRKCEKATTDLALTGSRQMVADTLRALADSIHKPPHPVVAPPAMPPWLAQAGDA